METIYRRNACWICRNSVFGKKGDVRNSLNCKIMTLQLVKGTKHRGMGNRHVQHFYLLKQKENIFTVRIWVKVNYLLHSELKQGCEKYSFLFFFMKQIELNFESESYFAIVLLRNGERREVTWRYPVGSCVYRRLSKTWKLAQGYVL